MFILYIFMETVKNKYIYIQYDSVFGFFFYPDPWCLNNVRKCMYPKQCVGPFSHSALLTLLSSEFQCWISVYNCSRSTTVTFSRKSRILMILGIIHLLRPIFFNVSVIELHTLEEMLINSEILPNLGQVNLIYYSITYILFICVREFANSMM